jgi:pescadillo protein
MAKAHKPRRKKNPRGTKKADKIHGTKKQTAGEAAAYMTRAQALAKLSLPLADFRKLCILKGIYPRDPKKKPAGNDKTYYHHKDIAFLAHEPLLNKFFELKTFMKKFKRLMGRNERSLAKSFEERKPEYTLHHLVRERYPSIEDAVRDLDDAISMLALFGAISADQKRDIPTDSVTEATRLYQELQLYVIRAQALRKVFVTIKGYYFQAEIMGTLVTWLAPHQFAQTLPEEVDFRVMLTFLEFYRTVVKFVNFKLYSDIGVAYPPNRNQKRDRAAADVASLEVEMREAGKARENQAAQGEQADVEVAAAVAQDFGEQSEEALEMQRQVALANRMKTTFRGLRVFVSREVALRPAYFTLLSGGATAVGWERGSSGLSANAGSAFPESSNTITHQIVDRPPSGFTQIEGREYVQPQWIFDSFNTGCLLPVAPYAPGRAPPPHLSPFVDDQAEGYVPRQREILDRVAAEASGVVDTAKGGTADGAASAADLAESKEHALKRFNDELKAEASGVWHADFKAKGEELLMASGDAKGDDTAEGSTPAEMVEVPKPTEEEEERLRRKALMPKKHKRLLQRIDKSAKKKQDENTSLREKRKKIEKGSA